MKMLTTVMFVALAMTGCKKKAATDAPAPAAGSGSAAPVAAPTTMSAPKSDKKLPAGVTDAMIADADKSLAAVTKFSTDVGATGTDCKKAADVLASSGPAMTGVVATFEAWRTAGNKDEKVADYWKDHYDQKFDDDSRDKASKVTFEACQKDAGFAAAMKANPFVAYLSNK